MHQVPLRPVYSYRRQDRTDKYPDNVCTTTVAVYHYFHYRRENVYFHLLRIELVPPRKRTLRRYNRRDDRRMHVL